MYMPICAKTFLEGNAKQWYSLRNVDRIWGSILLKKYIYLLGCTRSLLQHTNLVPWLGIEPRLPALGVWSLSHWTTREVSTFHFFRSFSIGQNSFIILFSRFIFFNCGSYKTYHVKFTFSDFEEYSSVVMAIFTLWCDTSLQLFYLTKPELSTFPSPWQSLFYCFPDAGTLNSSWKWAHTVFVLLWQAYFI